MRQVVGRIRLPLMVLGALLCLVIGGATPSHAQEGAQILFPQEGQIVRGVVTVRFGNIPAGGYLMLKFDDELIQATAQATWSLNTFPPMKEGKHTISVTAINASGKVVGQPAKVTFEVGNSVVSDVEGEGVKLVIWKPEDRLAGVQRFRIFAESNAIIEEAQEGGGEGGRGGGGGAGAGGNAGGNQQQESIPAPLDYQVSALLRRMMRDVGMLDGSANIQNVIQFASERQREGDAAGGAGGAGGAAAAAAPRRRKEANKPPAKSKWGAWSAARETGQYFIKAIKPNGEEVNGTRKSPTITITDLLPMFPVTEVRPGSTWETTMTFIAELSERTSINVRAPITFTTFENIKTPLGIDYRTAKLETRFRLPDSVSKSIAMKLQTKVGSKTTGAAAASGAGAGGGGGAAAPAGAGGGAGGDAGFDMEPEDFIVCRTEVARTVWFDVENRRVLRSEDVITTYYEYLKYEEAAEGAEGGAPIRAAGLVSPTFRTNLQMGGGFGGPPAGGPGAFGGPGGTGGPGGAAVKPKEPTKVNYQLVVTTWYDDVPPPPTGGYTGGAGTAHARDSVKDPTLERILKVRD